LKVPRAHRLQIPGGIYHVTARGNRKLPIFLAEGDQDRLLAILGRVAGDLGWQCHSYCLMPNHYHVVLETPEANLSAGMHRLNSTYAHWFNVRHSVEGHLFQGRFHAVLIESEWHLLELARYVVLNPVRAGLCVQAGEWPWSSYSALVGRRRPPPFLYPQRVLGYFGRDRESALRAFEVFVRDAWARHL
jgi:putative transposase